MLVIHIVSSQDTKDFSDIYDGLNAIVLVNPSKSECKWSEYLTNSLSNNEKILFITIMKQCVR